MKGVIFIRIVADSSCDLNKELEEKLNLTHVPLTITLGDVHYRDDENLDVPGMLDDIDNSDEEPKSTCPSPHDFMEAFKEKGSVFVVTMTAALSGTYNSARVARDLFIQDYEDKFIHIFNSKGSSVRETLIAIKIKELIDAKLSENEIVDKVNKYIDSQKYFFQFGSIDTMVKNGRIPKLKGMIASVLNIKPILFADENGEVDVYANIRSDKKALRIFVDIIGEHCNDFSERILGISHCEALEKAETLKAAIEEKYNFKEIIIVPVRGLSSIYISRGGITVAF